MINRKRLIYLLAIVVVSFGLTYLIQLSMGGSGSVEEDKVYQETLAKLKAQQKKQPRAQSKVANKTTPEQLAQALKKGLPPGLQLGFQSDSQQSIENRGSEESDTSVPDVIEPTPRDLARMTAKGSTGKPDPFAPLDTTKLFPKFAHKADGGQHESSSLPPPPETMGSLPPPPDAPTGDEEPSLAEPPPALPARSIPHPPEMPLLMRRFKVNGIIGDRAVLEFKRENSHKSFITLGEGEVFDTVKLLAIKSDSVVLEEDGRTREIDLPPIK